MADGWFVYIYIFWQTLTVLFPPLFFIPFFLFSFCFPFFSSISFLFPFLPPSLFLVYKNITVYLFISKLYQQMWNEQMKERAKTVWNHNLDNDIQQRNMIEKQKNKLLKLTIYLYNMFCLNSFIKYDKIVFKRITKFFYCDLCQQIP